MASVPQPSVSSVRQELYRRMDKHNLAPLWEVLHSLIPDEPMTPCKPALWKYRDARPYLMEAGKLITAKEAIRRVLVLENPGMRGESCITQSLYAGLQLILPGEIAPSHRHSQSALRFIVEGAGAYTAVDGERTTMRPGDFIITPSWTWHDHGNPEDGEPVVWMDGLDIRIVQTFAAQFHQVFPEEVQPVSRSEGASVARFGQGLVPVGAAAPFGKTSPIFNYPYERSRDSLARMAQDEDPDACHGWKMEFINPHSMLHLDVKNPNGGVTTWVFQTTNAGSLRSRGLARTDLVQGATYTIKGFAARNGNPMGFLRVLVFPNKKEMTFWFGDPND